MPSQYLQTISTLYLVQKKFQFEAISLLVHTFPRVAQAMCSGLRRLCAGLIENEAKLSPAKLVNLVNLVKGVGGYCCVRGPKWPT